MTTEYESLQVEPLAYSERSQIQFTDRVEIVGGKYAGCGKRLPRLRNSGLENLVQDVERYGIGTRREILMILVPALSHANVLPTWSFPAWCSDIIDNLVYQGQWPDALYNCTELLTMMQYRGADDSFARDANVKVSAFLRRFVQSLEVSSELGADSEQRSFFSLRTYIEEHELLRKRFLLSLPHSSKKKLILDRLGIASQSDADRGRQSGTPDALISPNGGDDGVEERGRCSPESSLTEFSGCTDDLDDSLDLDG